MSVHAGREGMCYWHDIEFGSTEKYACNIETEKMVGVTSTKKTHFVGFAFLESEKEENVTWALEACRVMLKEKS